MNLDIPRHTFMHAHTHANTSVCGVHSWAGNTFAIYTSMCKGLNLISNISLDWSLFRLLRQGVLLDMEFPNSR